MSIKECRDLLNINSRGTINDYLKTLELFGLKHLTWEQLRQVLELQTYLGLRHGYNSKDMFRKLSRKQITEIFSEYGIDIDVRMRSIQQKRENQNTHRDSVQSKLVLH